MRVSINEIQTIILKACIAVGLPVGISQDASQAAEHVFPLYRGSMEPFADAISAVDRKYANEFNVSQAAKGIFKSSVIEKKLSALYTAPTVCDQILVHNKNNQGHLLITLINLDVPAIIIFEILSISRFLNSDIGITWIIDQGDTMQGVCEGGEIKFDRGNYQDLFLIRNSTLVLSTTNCVSALDHTYIDKLDVLNNLNIDTSTWNNLSKYAERLLVPSSDTSRMTGAGAGTIDTD